MTHSSLFSPEFRHSAQATCAFSPGSSLCAVALDDHIIVRFTEDMQLATHFVCTLDEGDGNASSEPIQIKQLAWRHDSQYLLACAPQIGIMWVFAIADATRKPRAVVKAGIEGFVRCEWSGTGTEVLCFSDNGLRITIYSLTDGETSYIQGFKNTMGCHTYSPDRQYFALVERHHNKEHLCVYDAGDRYNLVRSFPLPTTDTQGISWSPCGRWLGVWESRLEYAIYIYSPLGPLLGRFTPSSSSFTGADPGLGIRAVSWSPGGNWLAIGGWDGKLRIIEADGWRCISTIDPATRPPTRVTAVWRQPSDWLQQSKGTNPVPFSTAPMFHEWPRRKATPTKSNPNRGISQIDWNVDGSCFAVRSDTIPNVVQMYSFLSDSSASLPSSINMTTAIIFRQPIRQMKWNPRHTRKLAMCTLAEDLTQSSVNSGIFMWDGEWEEEDSFIEAGGTEQGVVEATVIPFAGFQTHDIRWAPDGTALSIIDRDQFCVLHEAESFASDAMSGSKELSLIQE